MFIPSAFGANVAIESGVDIEGTSMKPSFAGCSAKLSEQFWDSTWTLRSPRWVDLGDAAALMATASVVCCSVMVDKVALTALLRRRRALVSWFGMLDWTDDMGLLFDFWFRSFEVEEVFFGKFKEQIQPCLYRLSLLGATLGNKSVNDRS
jgi:hypothetical protein